MLCVPNGRHCCHCGCCQAQFTSRHVYSRFASAGLVPLNSPCLLWYRSRPIVDGCWMTRRFTWRIHQYTRAYTHTYIPTNTKTSIYYQKFLENLINIFGGKWTATRNQTELHDPKTRRRLFLFSNINFVSFFGNRQMCFHCVRFWGLYFLLFISCRFLWGYSFHFISIGLFRCAGFCCWICLSSGWWFGLPSGSLQLNELSKFKQTVLLFIYWWTRRNWIYGKLIFFLSKQEVSTKLYSSLRASVSHDSHSRTICKLVNECHLKRCVRHVWHSLCKLVLRVQLHFHPFFFCVGSSRRSECIVVDEETNKKIESISSMTAHQMASFDNWN